MRSRESLQGKAYALFLGEMMKAFMVVLRHMKNISKPKRHPITSVRKKYEQYNDVLEEAIEEVEQEELEGVNDSESEDINERQAFTTDADEFVFFTQTGHRNIDSMTLDMIWV